jgi:hypothetical protein
MLRRNIGSFAKFTCGGSEHRRSLRLILRWALDMMNDRHFPRRLNGYESTGGLVKTAQKRQTTKADRPPLLFAPCHGSM